MKIKKNKRDIEASFNENTAVQSKNRFQENLQEGSLAEGTLSEAT